VSDEERPRRRRIPRIVAESTALSLSSSDWSGGVISQPPRDRCERLTRFNQQKSAFLDTQRQPRAKNSRARAGFSSGREDMSHSAPPPLSTEARSLESDDSEQRSHRMARNRDPFASALRTLRERAIAGAFSPGKPIIIL